MSFVPIQRNTVALTTIAIIAALGMIVRFAIQIPVVPNLVELTPGFLFSILGGVIGGIPGGILAGITVGLGGALAGGSLELLTLFGNLFLGIGGGYAIYFAKRDTMIYRIMVVLGAGLIGGLIPSMTLFAAVGVPFEVNLFFASIDMAQGFLWGVVALVVERTLIRPIVGSYLYYDVELEELDEQEG